MKKGPKVTSGRFFILLLIGCIIYWSIYHHQAISQQMQKFILKHIRARPEYIPNTRPMHYGPKPWGYDTMPLDTGYGIKIIRVTQMGAH